MDKSVSDKVNWPKSDVDLETNNQTENFLKTNQAGVVFKNTGSSCKEKGVILILGTLAYE